MLGNFLFKIITKILVNQLVKIASQIVSSNQFGFIKGWQVQDCIAAVPKCLNLLDKKYF